MLIVCEVCRLVADFRLQTRRRRGWGSGTGRPTSRTLTSVSNLSWTMAKTKPVSKWPFSRQNIYLAFHEILFDGAFVCGDTLSYHWIHLSSFSIDLGTRSNLKRWCWTVLDQWCLSTSPILRIQFKLNTALLSYCPSVCPCVRHRRDISHFSHI